MFHIQPRFTSENIWSSVRIGKGSFFFWTMYSITYSTVVNKLDFGVKKTWL